MGRKRSGHNASFDTLESPLGTLYLIFGDGVLRGLSFDRPHDMHIDGAPEETAKEQLTEYFQGGRRLFTVPTAFSAGTPFEQKVWQVLREIPYGETRTYKWLAGRVGKGTAFRAVGNALGKNPIPIIFPCHRIIESDGSLGGYSGGIEIKRRLLDLEYYNSLSA